VKRDAPNATANREQSGVVHRRSTTDEPLHAERWSIPLTDVAESPAIARNIRIVLENIRRAAERVRRQPDRVRLIGATKTVPVPRLREAMAAGLTEFGENRLQEALEKIEQIGYGRAHWHFIGRLQRRKAKAVVGVFELIHSLDSVELAAEINRRAEQAGISQPVLLEINIGGEASKGGFAPGAVAEVLPELNAMPHLLIRGLMTIPPPSADPEDARPYFRRLRELAQSLARSGLERISMDELSMGMSHDYEVAVEEGATMVRIGTAIFGARHA
jgi:pyridoxal phosphate enzyme (YggS family)